MALEKNSAVSKVAMQILSYFERNPGTADSLEGIVRWRLLQERIHRTLQETQQALEWLVEQGYVAEEKRRSAGTLYRLNPERKKQIEELSGQEKGANEPEIEETH